MLTCAALWAALLFCPTGFVAAGPEPATATARASTEVTDLRCEYMKTPLGIDDANPALSWTIRDTRRGVAQTARRILVASSPEILALGQGDLWDSGEITSDRSHLVAYEGKPLVSRQRCFWKVQVKTRAADGVQSPAVWSQPSWWEMGLLKPEDWQGSWIESPACHPVENETTRLWARQALIPQELNQPAVMKSKPLAEAVRIEGERLMGSVLPVPVFRTTFEVPGKIRRARLYISGLGFQEAFVNGTAVSDRLHDPSVTDYQGRGGYVTHDITALVHGGGNVFTAIVGGGWWNESMIWGSPETVMGRPSLRAQVEVELSGGRRIVIPTSGQWTTAAGPILKSHYYAGEVYDARRAPGWASGKDDGLSWAAATEVKAPVPVLAAQRCEPERAIRRVKPVAVKQPRPGIWVFDLGELIVGTVELRLKAPAGTTLVLRTAEWTWNPDQQGENFRTSLLHYDEGDNRVRTPGMIVGKPRGGTYFRFNFRAKGGGNLRQVHLGVPTLVYVARGDAAGETWRPAFTAHPFRYVEVQGLKEPPAPDLIMGLVITNDEEVVGSFSSANSRFNDIFEACMNSTRYNTHGMAWDNAVERLQSQVYNAWSAPFASYLLWYPNLWRKILEDQRQVNQPKPGEGQAFANVVYGQRGGRGWATKSPTRLVVSESVTVELPLQLYERYGELRELKWHYPQMKAWVEACIDPRSGKPRKGAFAGGWNDHFNIETAADSEFVPAFEEAALLGMLLHQWVRDTASTARLLGANQDAASLERLAQTVRDEVNRSWYDADHQTYGAARVKKGGRIDARYGWHGLMAMAIATGVAPEKDIPALLDNCIADMKAHYNGHHAAGHITHQLLYDVYSDHGMIETCYDMMNATSFPSFTWQLQSGNRTIPEGPSWKDFLPAKASAFQNECQEPARWFTQTLCGVAPDRAEPGFKHVLLRPRIPSRLPSARLATTTPYGDLESRWSQESGVVTWTVRIPANSHATAWIPAPRAELVQESGRPLNAAPGCKVQGQGVDGVECHLGSGAYQFRFPAPANAPSRLSELK